MDARRTNDPKGWGGVGLTETRHLSLDLPEGGFRLESGGSLPRVDIAYETYGELSEARDNVVFICHALTGDAHAAGYTADDVKRPSGWWDNMIGPGRGIDTDRFHVVCANILGGCKGTTGPSSPNPADGGRPYGSRFPDMTVGDIVDVHVLFLRQLGIRRVHAVVGGSFGGMQALALAVRHPEMVAGVVCIATGASLSTQALAFDVIGRAAIVNDPDWRGGDYYADGRAPVAGLAQARQLAHITYLSETLMKEKFGRRVRPDIEEASLRWAEAAHSPFEVESYLDHQGDKFVRRFDANSYLCIMRAMDRFDLGGTPETLRDAIAPVQARALVVSLSGDWLFSSEQSAVLARGFLDAGKEVSLFPLDAPAGHDAFLTHIGDLQRVLAAFLGGQGAAEVPSSKFQVPSHPLLPERGTSDSDPARPAQPDEQRLVETERFVDLVPAEARRILDLGCGDGDLLDAVRRRRPECVTTGLDHCLADAVHALSHGHDILLSNIDDNLRLLPDDSYDCILLSETLQVIRRPDHTLREMLRIAPSAVISFPNFGHWRVLRNLLATGRMPKSKRLPYEWFDTPNIRCCTLRDVVALCREQGFEIEKLEYFCSSPVSKLLLRLGLRNLGASRVLARIRRRA